MKSNKVNLLLIILAVIIQRVLFQIAEFDLYEFPFATSLLIFQSQRGNILLILYTLLPVPFILFEFSGIIHELTNGYGKLWIIRAYRKDRLYVKTIIICALKLFMIVLYQVLVFCFGAIRWHPLPRDQALWGLAAYCAALLAVVLLQFLLELSASAALANLISNLLFASALFLENLMLQPEKAKLMAIVLVGISAAAGCLGIIKFNNKDMF